MEFDIPFDKVMDLHLEKNGVIYKTGNKKNPVDMQIMTPEEFSRFKFELVKWIKKKPEPDDRVMHFETEIDGLWSYDKEMRLIESRKTRIEKAKELKDKIDFHNECKKAGIK